jgi:aminoglycoside phosphotransferase (APT) family kinase protein
MRLWRFPHDPGLPQLARLLDPGFTLPWWPRPASAVDTLRYEPEQRATLCFRHGAEVLFAKTFADDRAEAVHRRFLHFWQLSQRNPFAPTVAEPLGHDAATRSVWQAEAEGRPLREWLQAAEPSWVAVRLAAAFATVHAAPPALAGPLPRDLDHWRREIARRSRKIARALPALAPRVQAIAEALERASAALPAQPLVLIHGDCHPDQVWLTADDRVVLFDFDEFTLGDPMEDLAQFVTRLGDAGGSARFGSEIVAAYANVAPAAFSAPRLRWQLALQQLLQASRAFVFQAPGWPLMLAQRLARAEMLLDDARPFSPEQLAA